MIAIKRFNDAVNGGSGYSIMECPWCKGYLKPGQVYDAKKQVWKFDRMLTPIRARYICGTCNHGVQYEM